MMAARAQQRRSGRPRAADPAVSQAEWPLPPPPPVPPRWRVQRKQQMKQQRKQQRRRRHAGRCEARCCLWSLRWWRAIRQTADQPALAPQRASEDRSRSQARQRQTLSRLPRRRAREAAGASRHQRRSPYALLRSALAFRRLWTDDGAEKALNVERAPRPPDQLWARTTSGQDAAAIRWPCETACVARR